MDRQNGERILKAAKRLLWTAGKLGWVGVAGVGVCVLVALGVLILAPAEILLYLGLKGPIGLVDYLLGVGYALAGLGVIGCLLYLPGLHFLGLGQLVLNTACDPVDISEKEEPPEEIPEEAPAEEEKQEEPAQEQEEEPDWKALLEQDDALIPRVKTPRELVEQLPPPGKSGRLVSPALMNILRYSLGQEEDGQLEKNLKHGISRLTKSHERELLGYVLHTPDGDVRSAAAELYKALNEKK